MKNEAGLLGSCGSCKRVGTDVKGLSPASKQVLFQRGLRLKSSNGTLSCPALHQWHTPRGTEETPRGLFSTFEYDLARFPHFASHAQSPVTLRTAMKYRSPCSLSTPCRSTCKESLVMKFRIAFNARSSLFIFGSTHVNILWMLLFSL